MHNAAAADLGLDLAYLPLAVEPEKLAAAVRGLAALGFVGANVTVPHKEAVIPLLDIIDPAAEAIGAVNTIIVSPEPASAGGQPSTLAGYNTDWSGFMADLDRLGVEVGGRESLILGAGGSARAVAYGLAMAGCRVHICARREEQARQVVDALANHCPPNSLAAHGWRALQDANVRFPATALLVNTTPLGMVPQVDASPWPDTVALPKKAFVYDLVYNPAETRFMRQAREAGHQASNGLGMLLRQGALAFKLWTDLEPDLAIMAQALRLKP
jgi:shikimate dehydrogenase